MKGKLITNGILSIVWLIGFILLCVAIANTVSGHFETTYYGYYQSTVWVSGGSIADASTYLVGLIMIILSGIASFVMGIVTLATNKSKEGIVIASGVLAILSGLFGINAIVSFIAAKKVI